LNFFPRNKTPQTAEAPQLPRITKGESMNEFEVFPSPTFQAEVRSAAARLDKVRSELEALQECLPKLRKNREALELAGQDPEAEIAKTSAQIAETERELSRAKDSMRSLFAAEQARYTLARQQLWESFYLVSIETARSQFVSLVSTIRNISEQLIALKSVPVTDAVSSSNLDAGVAALNALAAEHKLPSNFSISTNLSLSHSFGHAVREMLKTADIDAALKEIRECLETVDTSKAVSQFEPAFASPSGSRRLWDGR
jgi:chromosome segregation ATPase